MWVFAFQAGVNRLRTTGFITPAETRVEVVLPESKTTKRLLFLIIFSQNDSPAIPKPTTMKSNFCIVYILKNPETIKLQGLRFYIK